MKRWDREREGESDRKRNVGIYKWQRRNVCTWLNDR